MPRKQYQSFLYFITLQPIRTSMHLQSFKKIYRGHETCLIETAPLTGYVGLNIILGVCKCKLYIYCLGAQEYI